MYKWQEIEKEAKKVTVTRMNEKKKSERETFATC